MVDNFDHYNMGSIPFSNTVILNIFRTEVKIRFKLLWTSFFEHGMNSNVFIYWCSNSNTWILASNEWISNIEPKRIPLDLLNYSLNRIEHHFFEHWTDSNVFILWLLNSNTLSLALNDRTSYKAKCKVL